jgi:hypothetical protein
MTRHRLLKSSSDAGCDPMTFAASRALKVLVSARRLLHQSMS